MRNKQPFNNLATDATCTGCWGLRLSRCSRVVGHWHTRDGPVWAAAAGLKSPLPLSRATASTAALAAAVVASPVSEFKPGRLSAFGPAVRRRDDRRWGRRPPQPRRGRARAKLRRRRQRRRNRRRERPTQQVARSRLGRGPQPRSLPMQVRRRRRRRISAKVGGRRRARPRPAPPWPHRRVRQVGRQPCRQQRPRSALRRAQAGRVLRRPSGVSPGRCTFELPAAAVECWVEPGLGRRRRRPWRRTSRQPRRPPGRNRPESCWRRRRWWRQRQVLCRCKGMQRKGRRWAQWPRLLGPLMARQP